MFSPNRIEGLPDYANSGDICFVMITDGVEGVRKIEPPPSRGEMNLAVLRLMNKGLRDDANDLHALCKEWYPWLYLSHKKPVHGEVRRYVVKKRPDAENGYFTRILVSTFWPKMTEKDKLVFQYNGDYATIWPEYRKSLVASRCRYEKRLKHRDDIKREINESKDNPRHYVYWNPGEVENHGG